MNDPVEIIARALVSEVYELTGSNITTEDAAVSARAALSALEAAGYVCVKRGQIEAVEDGLLHLGWVVSSGEIASEIETVPLTLRSRREYGEAREWWQSRNERGQMRGPLLRLELRAMLDAAGRSSAAGRDEGAEGQE